jgi:hypothetical protein
MASRRLRLKQFAVNQHLLVVLSKTLMQKADGISVGSEGLGPEQLVLSELRSIHHEAVRNIGSHALAE